MYKVTIQAVPNLPLTSKLKFHFSMRFMYKTQPLFWCQREVWHNLNGHPVFNLLNFISRVTFVCFLTQLWAYDPPTSLLLQKFSYKCDARAVQMLSLRQSRRRTTRCSWTRIWTLLNPRWIRRVRKFTIWETRAWSVICWRGSYNGSLSDHDWWSWSKSVL